MRLCKFLALLLVVHQSILAGAQDDIDDGPILINLLPTDINDTSRNDTGTKGSQDALFSAIAHQLNCTTLEIRHEGIRTEEALRDTIFQQITTKTTERPNDFKYSLESDYEDDVTPNPENESTKKPTKEDKKTKSKRSPDDVNPSKNVTINHNYSIVKKYPDVQNISQPNEEEDVAECTAPFYDNGEEYFWYQIIFENGGRPGEVFNATRLTPNVTEVLNPCERPIKKTVPESEDLLYTYELIEFERVYRREEAYLRFAGTPSEFVDVHGHFVWSPPGYRGRYYRLEYRKDDTGFYVQVYHGEKCVFGESPVSVKCGTPGQACFCDNGAETCSNIKVLSSAVPASLVGGGG